jgi:hypothetical protein
LSTRYSSIKSCCFADNFGFDTGSDRFEVGFDRFGVGFILVLAGLGYLWALPFGVGLDFWVGFVFDGFMAEIIRGEKWQGRHEMGKGWR